MGLRVSALLVLTPWGYLCRKRAFINQNLVAMKIQYHQSRYHVQSLAQDTGFQLLSGTKSSKDIHALWVLRWFEKDVG